MRHYLAGMGKPNHNPLTLDDLQELRDAGYRFLQATLYAVTERTHGYYPHVRYADHGKGLGLRPWVILPPTKEN